MSGNIQGISFINRDLSGLKAAIAAYIPKYIPEITDTSQANPGTLFLGLIAGIVDTLQFSTDIGVIENLWGVTQQKRNMVEQAEGIGWYYPGPSPAKVELTFTSPVPAGAGGLLIPRFLVCTTRDTPTKKFVTIETGVIPQGSNTVTVTAVEGERVVDEILTASGPGGSNQRYTLAATQVPFEYVEIKVNGEEWLRQADTLLDSELTDKHFVCRIVKSDFLRTYVQFGNDEFGLAPSPGANIKATYIKCNGAAGNTPAGTITKIVGPLSASFSVTNAEGALGGSDGPATEDIRVRAPFEAHINGIYVTAPNFRAGAESVPGVHTAVVTDIIGSTATVYVLPDGGGIAPQALLDSVQTELQNGALIGSLIQVKSTQLAEVTLSAKVQLRSTDLSRQEARERVLAALLAQVDYRVQEIGRGFRISDVMSIIRNVDNGTLVDFAEITKLTRIPRVIKEGVADPTTLPDIQGEVTVGLLASYTEYQLTPDTEIPTNFIVTQGGTVIPNQATGLATTPLGSLFRNTSPAGDVSFTFGNAGDSWTEGLVRFSTSKYNGNLQLGLEEIMAVSNIAQIDVNIYYPGELNAFA